MRGHALSCRRIQPLPPRTNDRFGVWNQHNNRREGVVACHGVDVASLNAVRNYA
jgi:hypothetical protein